MNEPDINTEKQSREIKLNPETVSEIYNIVKAAAAITVKSDNVKAMANKTCVIKLNDIATKDGNKIYYLRDANRITTKCSDSSIYKIQYDPNDLTIVGGSSIILYDNKISKLVERKQREEVLTVQKLYKYTSKKAADIDIIWWPHIILKDILITSSSPAIIELVNEFTKQLKYKFKENKNKLNDVLKKSNDKDINLIDINVLYNPYGYMHSHFKIGGSHNIGIEFNIDGMLVKVVDIIIHDSGASQEYD